jgi:RND family efflux transporter MFP subunit
MIVAIFNIYLVLLFGLVKLRIVPFDFFWKVSPAIVLVLLLFGLFIPMGWGAPSGPALVIRNSVAIVADVAGEVIEVPIAANTPLKAGDVLFRIDPMPFQAQVDALEAQLRFEELRLSQMTQLERTQAGRAFDVEQRAATVEQLKAQIEGARWNLDKTVVRAPADGYVTNLALRKGARVANLPLTPVMAFIDTSDTLIGVEVAQADSRFIAPGQDVEITFKFLPGQIHTAKVLAVLQAISTGQVQASGLATTPTQVQAAPFVVRVKLDDKDLARRLPAGSVGDAAIFTDHVKVSHVIRKVLLRQIAILSYVNPF